MSVTFLVRKVIWALICFEMLVFVVLYVAGPAGVSSSGNIQLQIEQVGSNIKAVEREIVLLRDDIERSKHSFMQEKIARELLHMKKSNEKIYRVLE